MNRLASQENRTQPRTTKHSHAAHYTIYFNGHGTTQALTVLLIYFIAGAVIIGVLDWFRVQATVPVDVAEGAAMTAAAVGVP